MFEVDEKILEEMRSSSDRACVLVGHAHVEEEAKSMLKRLLRDDHEAFTAATKGGCLASHVGRVNLLYLLTVIDAEVRNDLKAMAEIRNLFAHNSEIRDFGHKDIQKPFAKIRFLNVTNGIHKLLEGEEPSKRMEFEYCVGNAVAILRQRVGRLG